MARPNSSILPQIKEGAQRNRRKKTWVVKSSNFRQPFRKIQSSDCGTREFTDQKRTKMTVADFVEKWLHVTSGLVSRSYEPNVAIFEGLTFCEGVPGI
ncbi:hypothetical protein FF1_038892 [Malus domestica]